MEESGHTPRIEWKAMLLPSGHFTPESIIVPVNIARCTLVFNYRLTVVAVFDCALFQEILVIVCCTE